MLHIDSVKPRHGSRLRPANLAICLVISALLALIQPGMSYYWLIDQHLHAAIDAEEYGQQPDGRPLPGHPEHPPHQHPSSDGLPNTDAVSLNGLDAAYYNAIFSEANRPSLQGWHSEAVVIDTSVFLDPPEHPPRA